ncbi:hypothetical protein [Streptomonospora sediminis]
MASPDLILGDLKGPGGPLPGNSVEARSVNLRWRRTLTWTSLTVFSVALAAAIAIRMSTEVGKPYIGTSEITGGVVFFVGSVGVALWMAWVAPRVFTRQAVAADTIGVALIQEPNLWFPGKTVRIPWDAIRSISAEVRPAGNSGERKTVDLVVDTEHQRPTVPSWAGTLPVPASEESPPQTRIIITPGNKWQPKILQALGEVRPDLCT